MWERKFLGSPRPGVSTCGLKGGKLPPPLARTSQGPASQQHRRNQSRQGEALDFVTITSCSCKICRWLEGNEVRTVRACFLLSNRRGLPRIPPPPPHPAHSHTHPRPHGLTAPSTRVRRSQDEPRSLHRAVGTAQLPTPEHTPFSPAGNEMHFYLHCH